MDFSLPVIAIIISLVLDIIVYLLLPANKNTARIAAVSSMFFVSFGSFASVFADSTFMTTLLVILGVFRLINLARVVYSRMHAQELKRRYTATFLWFDSLTFLNLIFIKSNIPSVVLNALLVMSVIGSVFIFLNTIFSVIHWRSQKTPKRQIRKLPTVSVCIPARNETQDLPECVESLLTSTYPKLEILVLDDCSHDKTPQIIKKYAHQGVRFISGDDPKADWLPKNQALNKLYDESLGDIVIYSGVDVRFKPDSVMRIVEELHSGKHDMISLLPKRTLNSELSVFIQPLRYWWELSVPRFIGGRPPALSTLWAIKRKSLKRLGEFESYKKSVQPEAHFAKHVKSYKFILSGNRLGVTSRKQPKEQFDTALRMRYPQLGRSPEQVLGLITIQAILWVLPAIALIYGVFNDESIIIQLSVIALLLAILNNTLISILVVKKYWFYGLINGPFLVFEEWYILIRSMLAYEFGVVMWKERNICLPMLQAEKQLPKL